MYMLQDVRFQGQWRFKSWSSGSWCCEVMW